MKKIILLILCVLFLTVGCENKKTEDFKIIYIYRISEVKDPELLIKDYELAKKNTIGRIHLKITDKKTITKIETIMDSDVDYRFIPKTEEATYIIVIETAQNNEIYELVLTAERELALISTPNNESYSEIGLESTNVLKDMLFDRDY